jgi:hypothetical protein
MGYGRSNRRRYGSMRGTGLATYARDRVIAASGAGTRDDIAAACFGYLGAADLDFEASGPEKASEGPVRWPGNPGGAGAPRNPPLRGALRRVQRRAGAACGRARPSPEADHSERPAGTAVAAGRAGYSSEVSRLTARRMSSSVGRAYSRVVSRLA